MYNSALEQLAEEWEDLDQPLSALSDPVTDAQRYVEIQEIASEFGCNEPEDLSALADKAIPEYQFTDYIQEYALDSGAIDGDSWLFEYIDWEEVADSAQRDYSYADYDGTTYYWKD